MKGKTAFQKIIDGHIKGTLPDRRMVLKLDHVWCHEITTPSAILDAGSRGLDVVFNPNKIKAMIDHINPAKDTLSAIQGKILREWAEKHQVFFLDVGRNGVCHAIIPENGWILPGQIGIMGDSHTCTMGAFGAFCAGVGTTDLEAGLITGLWICPPQKVIRVNFTGALPYNVFSKDLILALINMIGVKGAINAVLEFGGPVIEKLSMDARMTITNMAVEAGATSGMMSTDMTLVKYLWPTIREYYSLPEEALRNFLALNSDLDCEYDEIIEINVSRLEPLITQNYSPEDVVPVSELRGKKINQVFIGSCTNGRLEDLRIAAHIFKRHGNVHEKVRCIIVPATPRIWEEANKEGLLDIFMKAGCLVSNPTCGACLGMSCGVLAPGEVCVATTNRNFHGRMGQDGMVHLTSPATAALSAILGHIGCPTFPMSCDNYCDTTAKRTNVCNVDFTPVDYIELVSRGDITNPPKDFSGRVFYLPQKNIDTDQIIPAKYLTETDKSQLAQHCLENVLSAEEKQDFFSCGILVANENFGSGSSREHAAWALEEVGIRCVIAPSFARIFRENMFNNGLLCIELSKIAIDILLASKPKRLSIDWEKGLIKGVELNTPYNFLFKLTDYEKDLIKNGGSIKTILKIAAALQGEEGL